MQQLSDQDLVAVLKSGGPDASLAWTEIVRRYGKMMHHTVRSVVWEAQNAEDVYQEVLVIAYLGIIRQYDGNRIESLRAWLRAVARNQAHNASKRIRRWKMVSLEDVGELSRAAAETTTIPSPDTRLIEFEDTAVVERWVATLKGREQKVVRLWLEGMKHGAIAIALGLPKAATSSQLFHSAKAKLSAVIAAERPYLRVRRARRIRRMIVFK